MVQKEWSALAYVPKKDDSNLVSGNNIYVGEVLLKTKELTRHVASTEKDELDMDDIALPVTEEAILCHAVGILKDCIALTSKFDR